MTRLLKILLCASLSGAAIAQAAETNALDAVPVDQNWQLFLDDCVVGRATGFNRVVHQPWSRPSGHRLG